MSTNSTDIVIRPWARSDIASIQRIAAMNSSFTVPSRYQLDMLQNSEPSLNLVATDSSSHVLGYVLTLWSHPGELFLWQFAKDQTLGREKLSAKGVHRLLLEFARNVKRSGASALQFTTQSNSATRWIRTIAPELLGTRVRELYFKVDGERAYELRFTEVPDGLSDVYSIPYFADFVDRIFSPSKISPDWLKSIQQLGPNDTILEIGAGDGRLTDHLLSTGAKVIAVEPCRSFDPRKGIIKGSPAEENLRIIRGFFPDISVEKCSHIILHQNVFTELINQMDESDLIAALKTSLKPGGRLLFDFVSEIDPGEIGSTYPIYDGHVQGLGNVSYQRQFIGKHWGMRYENLLRFSFERNGTRQHHSRRIEARFPLLDRVLREIGSQGGESKTQKIQAFTFFPGQPQIVEVGF